MKQSKQILATQDCTSSCRGLQKFSIQIIESFNDCIISQFWDQFHTYENERRARHLSSISVTYRTYNMNYHRNDPKSSQFGNKTKKNVTNKPKIPLGNFRNATSTNDVPTFRSVPMFEPLRPGKLQTMPTIEKPNMLRGQSTETTAAFTCDSLCSEQNFFFTDFSLVCLKDCFLWFKRY